MAIYLNTDHIVLLSGLYDIVTCAFVNDASVTGKLLNSTGGIVTTFLCPYIPGSNGDYRGAIPHSITASLNLEEVYTIDVIATSISSIVFEDRDEHVALWR